MLEYRTNKLMAVMNPCCFFNILPHLEYKLFFA